MRALFAYGLEAAVTAALFSGGLIALTAVHSGAAMGEQAALVSVDRTNKGDRLFLATTSKAKTKVSLSVVAPQLPPMRPPFGCDPAFSSFADPARAHIYKRCAA